MPALLIRISIWERLREWICCAAEWMDGKSERSIGMKWHSVEELIWEIMLITGWTLDSVRASRIMVDGLPRLRSMAVWAPRPLPEVPVITTGSCQLVCLTGL